MWCPRLSAVVLACVAAQSCTLKGRVGDASERCKALFCDAGVDAAQRADAGLPIGDPRFTVGDRQEFEDLGAALQGDWYGVYTAPDDTIPSVYFSFEVGARPGTGSFSYRCPQGEACDPFGVARAGAFSGTYELINLSREHDAEGAMHWDTVFGAISVNFSGMRLRLDNTLAFQVMRYPATAQDVGMRTNIVLVKGTPSDAGAPGAPTHADAATQGDIDAGALDARDASALDGGAP